ncbi:MAG: polymer-forming cytoskeletal protein [Gammaproteobacteria bacterium]|nr:polymer-forming cytoskeletal protein [Gammaproteobacteria bacterium]
MALWKEAQPEATVTPVTRLRPEPPPPAPAPVPASPREMKESVIASGLTFEGKIEGSGHVRISGRFKGDVHVDGTLTIEAGAHLAGSVRAGSVIIAGEIEGNIESANKVELQQTGVVNGDINAGSLTVASGARMRGRAEFGWTETGGQRLTGRG